MLLNIFAIVVEIYNRTIIKSNNTTQFLKQAQNLCIAVQNWTKLNKVKQSNTQFLSKIEQSWATLGKLEQTKPMLRLTKIEKSWAKTKKID